MKGAVLLSFEGVACRRGGRRLFSGLSIDLRAGEALVLTGPNGAGKSSIIRLAAGLLAPDEGRVAASASPGLLTHDLALDDMLGVERALRFWARLDGVEEAAVREAMDAMDLLPLAPVPVRLLSSGQKRRVALARVIAGGSRLWLLDEPGVGLDAHSLTLLADAMRRHRAAGGGVFAATHMDIGLENARVLDVGAMA